MVDSKIIFDFIHLLNSNNINCVIIKNDCNEIPYNLEDNRDIDFLVHPTEYDKLIELVKKMDMKKKSESHVKDIFYIN